MSLAQASSAFTGNFITLVAFQPLHGKMSDVLAGSQLYLLATPSLVLEFLSVISAENMNDFVAARAT